MSLQTVNFTGYGPIRRTMWLHVSIWGRFFIINLHVRAMVHSYSDALLFSSYSTYEFPEGWNWYSFKYSNFFLDFCCCPHFLETCFSDKWPLRDSLYWIFQRYIVDQGFYRLWKTWKVMKFKNFIFLESHGKLKLCLVDLLLQMSKQGQCAIDTSNNTNGLRICWRWEFVSVELSL